MATSASSPDTMPISKAGLALRKRTRQKRLAARVLGRRGGLLGGAAFYSALTPEQRRAFAVAGARARWEKYRHGNPLPAPNFCSVPGCPNRQVSLQMCRRHYTETRDAR